MGYGISNRIKNYDNFIQMMFNQCIKWHGVWQPNWSIFGSPTNLLHNCYAFAFEYSSDNKQRGGEGKKAPGLPHRTPIDERNIDAL